MTAATAFSTALLTIANSMPNDTQLASLATPEARSTPMHLQLNVTDGCTTRLSDISDPLNISAIRLGQALDALHLRDRCHPTQEAISHGLGHRWFNGRGYLVEWHIAGVTEVVTAHYDSIGWPSKPSSKGKPNTRPCHLGAAKGSGPQTVKE